MFRIGSFRKIVGGIAPNVRAAELRNAMRKKPENFTAYDCTLRAFISCTASTRTHFCRRDISGKGDGGGP